MIYSNTEFHPNSIDPQISSLVRLRLILFLAGVVFPAVAAVSFLVMEINESKPSGGSVNYSYRLLIESIKYFGFHIAFSMIGFISYLLSPRNQTSLLPRLGIYSGVIVSLQFSIIVSMAFYGLSVMVGLISLLAFWPFVWIGMTILKSFARTKVISLYGLMGMMMLVGLVVGSIADPEGFAILWFVGPLMTAFLGAAIPCFVSFLAASYWNWNTVWFPDQKKWQWIVAASTWFLTFFFAWVCTLNSVLTISSK